MGIALQRASSALVASEQTLNQSLEELNANKEKTEARLKSLEDSVGQAQKELNQVSVPFSWMPMHVQSFVKAFPALCALAFFILAIRFARLKLRSRLIRQMSHARIKEHDVELALCVPNITLGFLSPMTTQSLWQLRLLSVSVPLLTLAFLGFVLRRVQFSPLFKSDSSLLAQSAVVALGILTAILVLRSFRRYHLCKSGSESDSE